MVILPHPFDGGAPSVFYVALAPASGPRMRGRASRSQYESFCDMRTEVALEVGRYPPAQKHSAAVSRAVLVELP